MKGHSSIYVGFPVECQAYGWPSSNPNSSQGAFKLSKVGRKENDHGHYARQRKIHSNVDDADLAQSCPFSKLTCLLDVNTQTILPSRSLSRTPRGDRHPSLVRHRPVKLEIPNFRSQGISG